MLETSVFSELKHFRDYSERLSRVLEEFDWTPVKQLADDFLKCAKSGQQVFIVGNGGSAGNAIHLANDFLLAFSKTPGMGLRVQALAANPAVLTCIANDDGYDQIFSMQLAVQAREGDILLVFSGSGNSPNIVRALQEARDLNMKSYAVVGYSGGKAKTLADVPIHVQINDMQIAEDMQLIIGHMLMQWLCERGARMEMI